MSCIELMIFLVLGTIENSIKIPWGIMNMNFLLNCRFIFAMIVIMINAELVPTEGAHRKPQF